MEPTSSLVWGDVILADFQRVVSRYLQDISTYLSYIIQSQRVLRTIFMQKSKPKYACLPSKIVEVWIDWFCLRYHWWRQLQPTSSVSPVWENSLVKCVVNSPTWYPSNCIKLGISVFMFHLQPHNVFHGLYVASTLLFNVSVFIVVSDMSWGSDCNGSTPIQWRHNGHDRVSNHQQIFIPSTVYMVLIAHYIFMGSLLYTCCTFNL